MTIRLRLAGVQWMRGAAIVMFGLWPSLVVQAQAQDICASGAALVNPLVATSRDDPGAGGIGGTGISTGPAVATPGGDGGIGGTGVQALGPDPGGAATGQGGIGGTGIVGIITGFASICVNGVEVHFDAATPVSDAGESVSARQLAIGQLVAVSADGSGRQVRARRIALVHTAVGPLTSADVRAGTFKLLGQAGRVQDPANLANLTAGDWVRISGQRLAGGTIAATRLERVAPQSWVQLNGIIGRMDGNTLVVSGTHVQLASPSAATGMAVGSEVTISGAWDGVVLRAQRSVVEPTRSGLGTVGRVVLAGYVHALGERRISLGLGDLELSAGVQVVGAQGGQLAVDQHVQVTGRLGADQRVTIDRVVIGDGPSDGAGLGAQSRGGRRNRSERDSRIGDDRSGRSDRFENRQDSSGRGGSGDSSDSSGSSGSGSSGESGSSGGSGSSGSGGSESGEGGSGRGK